MEKGEMTRIKREDRLEHIRELKQQLAACQADLEEERKCRKKDDKAVNQYRTLYRDALKQLADAQAENLRLRRTLIAIGNHTIFEQDIADAALAALDTPPGDQSALREVVAQVLEEVAEDWEEEVDVGIRVQADRIRSGEWTPEALK